MSKDLKQKKPRKEDRRDITRREKNKAFDGSEKRDLDRRLWDRRKKDRTKNVRPEYKD